MICFLKNSDLTMFKHYFVVIFQVSENGEKYKAVKKSKAKNGDKREN